MFLREGLIGRRLRDFEEGKIETVCLELTLFKKILFIIFVFIDLLPTVIKINFSVHSQVF